MDTGGKDGTIKHVSRRQPQILVIQKSGDEEASHDFLWRYYRTRNAG